MRRLMKSHRRSVEGSPVGSHGQPACGWDSGMMTRGRASSAARMSHSALRRRVKARAERHRVCWLILGVPRLDGSAFAARTGSIGSDSMDNKSAAPLTLTVRSIVLTISELGSNILALSPWGSSWRRRPRTQPIRGAHDDVVALEGVTEAIPAFTHEYVEHAVSD
ncbi:MAG: hypothetical protein ACI9PP_002104 [Halobacteriales archaeon]|jgi:hypothetical protein